MGVAVRYRAVVATMNEDAFNYAFSDSALDELVGEAMGKPVRLLFTQDVGVVVSAERVLNEAQIVFEAIESLIDDGRFYCVPAFVGGELSSFGLVPVPADSSLTPVEVMVG